MTHTTAVSLSAQMHRPARRHESTATHTYAHKCTTVPGWMRFVRSVLRQPLSTLVKWSLVPQLQHSHTPSLCLYFLISWSIVMLCHSLPHDVCLKHQPPLFPYCVTKRHKMLFDTILVLFLICYYLFCSVCCYVILRGTNSPLFKLKWNHSWGNYSLHTISFSPCLHEWLCLHVFQCHACKHMQKDKDTVIQLQSWVAATQAVITGQATQIYRVLLYRAFPLSLMTANRNESRWLCYSTLRYNIHRVRQNCPPRTMEMWIWVINVHWTLNKWYTRHVFKLLGTQMHFSSDSLFAQFLDVSILGCFSLWTEHIWVKWNTTLFHHAKISQHPTQII